MYNENIKNIMKKKKKAKQTKKKVQLKMFVKFRIISFLFLFFAYQLNNVKGSTQSIINQ